MLKFNFTDEAAETFPSRLANALRDCGLKSEYVDHEVKRNMEFISNADCDHFVLFVYDIGTWLYKQRDDAMAGEEYHHALGDLVQNPIRGNTLNSGKFITIDDKLNVSEGVEPAKKQYEECLAKVDAAFRRLGIHVPDGDEIRMPVVIKCEDYLKEQREFARSIGDRSLDDCLLRFENYRKTSADDRVEVYQDPWAEHSFYFCLMRGERCAMNGGIIFHGDPKGGYRSNGSVMMEPQFGWQIHT